MNLHEYPDREMMMLSLANIIAGQLGEILRRDGKATLCVPGGTTPGAIFDTLAGVDLDWANVAVMLNDERWVPEDHPRSNTRLLRQRLLQSRAAAAHLVPLYADAPNPEDRLAELGQAIAPYLPISVLLVGMGADMHTASLFPGADLLDAALSPSAPILMALRSEAAQEPRITLTAPVLRNALYTHLVITGPEKRAALGRAATLTTAEAPVRVILDHATVHWAE